jgi:hypothetical protein
MIKREEIRKGIELRTEMALNREIDRQLDRLIRAAGQRVHLLHDDRVMRESQLRNVLNVAISHPQSHLVVTNFIYYQVGRSGGNQAWLHSDFGKKVADDIQGPDGVVRQLASNVTDEVCRKVQESNREEVAHEAHMRLMRLYLGYLNRWFYYGSRTRQWKDIEDATKEESNV